jgi:hypothetical protein
MSDPTLSKQPDSTSTTVAAPTLGGFGAAVETAAGVWLSSLASIDQLEVRTRNSVYQITMLGGGRVLVRGGAFFPDWTEAHLAGATLGGSFLKMNWVGAGFCMEFLHQGQRITTTHVKEIRKIDLPPATVC